MWSGIHVANYFGYLWSGIHAAKLFPEIPGHFGIYGRKLGHEIKISPKIGHFSRFLGRKIIHEKEFLCEKLRGHITYDLTDYRPGPWYQQHFIMKYGDEVLLDVRQPRIYKDKRYDHYDGA